MSVTSADTGLGGSSHGLDPLGMQDQIEDIASTKIKRLKLKTARLKLKCQRLESKLRDKRTTIDDLKSSKEAVLLQNEILKVSIYTVNQMLLMFMCKVR